MEPRTPAADRAGRPETAPPRAPLDSRTLGEEVLVVLSLSLLASAVYALLDLLEAPIAGTYVASADQNPELDTLRLPSVYNLDLRLAKSLKVGGSSFLVSADLFNVFNANTELSRFRQASSGLYDKETGAGAFNRLDEILNPRVFRLGVRFQF